MTTGSTVCLQLGSAVATNPNSYSQTFVAKNADEITSSKKGLSPYSLDQLDVVVDGSELANIYNPMELATWVPLLSPSSVVSIQVRGANNGKIDLQPINTSFLLAGLKCASERREADGSRILTATRKATVPVSAAPLRLRKKNIIAVNINLDVDLDVVDDDDDMIDEDGLLEDNNLLAPPPAISSQSEVNNDDDCAGRKPCDNCSCGRAEREAASTTGEAPKIAAPSSSCGSCSLGDAFRCAGCPFLGKPAFKAGDEHIVLQLTDDL